MLRIIAGEFRSRRLLGPAEEEGSRPYPDRVKESVFNQLGEAVENARVLDLFAGVGTVGLEAVSRGAAAVLMVERSRDTFGRLERNIAALGCGDRATAMHGDALAQTCLLAAPRPVDLLFVDPAYRMIRDSQSRQRLIDQVSRCRKIMAETGLVVLRSPLGPEDADLSLPGFLGPEAHRYGPKMWVLFYEPDASQADPSPPDHGA